MSGTMVDDTAFPQFPRLPPELRSLVWTFAAADADQPTLFVYSDHWVTQFLEDADDGEDGGDSLIGQLDLEPYVQVHMPIVHVSREARGAGLLWASQRAIRMKLDPERGTHVFLREWDRRRDSLFIPRSKWADFLDLATDYVEGWRRIGAAIHHLALPAFTAYYSLETLAELLEVTPNIEKIYIVWGETPETLLWWDKNQTGGGGIKAGYFDYYGGSGGIATGIHLPDEEEGGREREVQPRWVLETEDSEEVQMYVKDHRGSSHISEWGSLTEYLFDIADMMTTIEWPKFLVDQKTKEFKLPLISVKAVRESKVDARVEDGEEEGEMSPSEVESDNGSDDGQTSQREGVEDPVTEGREDAG